MEYALRDVLPKREEPKQASQADVVQTEDSRSGQPVRRIPTITLTPKDRKPPAAKKQTKARAAEGKKKSPIQTKAPRKQKKASASKADRAALVRQKIATLKELREAQSAAAAQAVRKNARDRLAFNCRRGATRNAPLAESIAEWSFEELRRRWLRLLTYLSLGPAGSTAPDVLAAQERLEAIEIEWQRRAALGRDDPDYFEWPTTEAQKGEGQLGSGDWHDVGVLGYLGYHVGKTSSLSAAERTMLLARVFEMRLPPLNSSQYMKGWSLPSSSGRLKKMAETIASLCRNGKRQPKARMAVAVADWEQDLNYLRVTYYVGRFNFGWPAT